MLPPALEDNFADFGVSAAPMVLERQVKGIQKFSAF
jgi:hypothetical protein